MVLLLIVFAAALVLIDRAMWASVSQWREDQATNIWLGYTQNPLQAPVGLVSSLGLPNPNGLVLISVLLSRLPNLWVISAFLGVVQAALVVWVTWLATREQALLAIALGPLLSSIVFRGISVEFWPNWSLIPVNLLFFGGIILYLRRRTLWAVPLWSAALMLSPSVYLAGVVNSIAYALIILIVLALWPPRLHGQRWVAPLVASGAILFLSIGVTWLPYFREVGWAALQQGSTYGDLTFKARLLAAAETILRFPLWSLSQYGGEGAMPPFQVDPALLSQRTLAGYELVLRVVFVQGLLCYATILIAGMTCLLRKQPISTLIIPARRTAGAALVLVAVFVLACYALAPLLGGVVWARGERLDQAVQFLPFVLLVWYLMPLVLELPGSVKKVVFAVTCASAIVTTALGLVIGVAVVRSNLLYRGTELPADVPVVDKLQVVGFVAEDWKARSASSAIPVDYDLGAGHWDWITDFGTRYEEWYPAPYTIGRGFDYLFLREYGLYNLQEGVQHRAFGEGRYLITYAFQLGPVLAGHPSHNQVFGRLRVTVIEDR